MAANKTRAINAADAPAPSGGYAQALELKAPSRLLFISGQIPIDQAGAVPKSFAAQCRLVWAHVDAQLKAAGMTLDQLVKVTTYLGDRKHARGLLPLRQWVAKCWAPAARH
ncbi:enamine deaminase RidA (YjgF/YER057c/UK114 family) [Pelomonas saccharophila]|uniref:Enamine deaminase RidA (YjgF/YER057c/UK114 family) n=2 Tax=Roseateles saccharophilus TaxID=304 RepID=A0ABU1YQZ0_ROSSA|nr:enamine deaminase RidA (YjgF/YER057c/UK114 family) [Roseateles saccharophilus]